jgi:hypothetical protein
MSDIYKEFGVDFLSTRYAGPTAAEMKMAQEITRLRARVEVLERALHAAKDAMAAVSVPRDNERAILFQAYDAALVALEAKP